MYEKYASISATTGIKPTEADLGSPTVPATTYNTGAVESTPTAPVAAPAEKTRAQKMYDKYAGIKGTSYDENQPTVHTIMGKTYDPAKPVAIRDLYSDQYQQTQRDYLKLFSGAAVDKMSNEEVADAYINRMRSWNAGNSMTVAEEVYDLWNFDESQRRTAGEAYKLFDNTQSIFSSDSSWGDTFGGLYDYTKAVIVDPTNIAALVGGAGVATRLGMKGAGATAKKLATRAATRVLEESLAKGVEKSAANAVSAQAYNTVFRKAMTRTAAKVALKAEGKKRLIGEITTDTALSFGVDYAQQSGLIMAGQQEDYSPVRSGLVALGALGGNLLGEGLRATGKLSNRFKEAAIAKAGGKPINTLSTTYQGLKLSATKTSKQAAKQAGKDITVNLDFALQTVISDPMKAMSPWKKKVARGELTKEAMPHTSLADDNDFWSYMFLGNDDAGVKGLVPTILNAGIIIPDKEATDDGIMNYLTDVVRQLPKEYKEKLAESFRATIGKGIPEYQKLSSGQLGDVIAKKFSDFGRGLNIASQARRMANNHVLSTAEEAAEDIMGKTAPSVSSNFLKRALKVQEQFLRAVTTHPATVALNAKGHFMMLQLDNTADITRAAFHYGLGFFSKSQKEQGRAIKNSLAYRTMSYMNPHATHDDFMNIISIHPDLLKKFTTSMYGGIDKIIDPEDFIKRYGFDPNDKTAFAKWMRGSDKYIEFFQTAYMAKSIDSWTKSTAYMGQLDKHLRLKFGADNGVVKFYNSPDLLKNMRTKEYLEVQSKAYEETMREVMSFAADTKNTEGLAGGVEHFAKFIEGLSRYPVIGALVPFGKFFNNTIRTMGDVSGTSFTLRGVGIAANGIHKALGGTGDVFKLSQRDTADLMAKGAVGWAAMLAYMSDYSNNKEKGLRYDQVMDDEGNIVNRQSEYPENFFRAAGAALYYKFSGEEMPKELMQSMATSFGPGQITRSFTDQEKGLIGAFNAVWDATNDPEASTTGILTAGTKILESVGIGTYISGGLRPLDPINHLAAMSRGSDYAPIDRNEGSKLMNNSLRYVDQIIAAMSGAVTGEAIELAPKKNIATHKDDIRIQPARIFSRNTMPPMSETEAVFNKIGRNLWDTTIKSRSPEANNAVNAFVAPFLEIEMGLLNNNPTFNSRPQPKKEDAVKNALGRAKKRALEAMANSGTVEDRRMKKLYQLVDKYNNDRVTEGLNFFKDSLGDKELYDMSEPELDMLDHYLDINAENLKKQ